MVHQNHEAINFNDKSGNCLERDGELDDGVEGHSYVHVHCETEKEGEKEVTGGEDLYLKFVQEMKPERCVR
jgi:hypothetical protein